MRKMLAVVCVVVFAFFVNGCRCEKDVDVREMRKSHAQRINRDKVACGFDAEEVINSIQYVKDSRTGLCFAYYWGNVSHDGPKIYWGNVSGPHNLALTTVPCDAIPPELLTVVK